MTSPDWPPAIAPHLAVMEECVVCKGAGKILHMWGRPGGPPGNGYAPCPACNGGLVDDGRAQALKDFAKNMNAFGLPQEAYDALPVENTPYGPAHNAGDVIHAQRRARAQAQPKDELGRFASPDPLMRHLRKSEWDHLWNSYDRAESEVRYLTATIAERDADLKSLRIWHDARGKMIDARIIELSAADRSMSEMAGTIRDLRAKITQPDLIPMPAMKLGIFIGSFVTMLVMTGLAVFMGII